MLFFCHLLFMRSIKSEHPATSNVQKKISKGRGISWATSSNALIKYKEIFSGRLKNYLFNTSEFVYHYQKLFQLVAWDADWEMFNLNMVVGRRDPRGAALIGGAFISGPIFSMIRIIQDKHFFFTAFGFMV